MVSLVGGFTGFLDIHCTGVLSISIHTLDITHCLVKLTGHYQSSNIRIIIA